MANNLSLSHFHYHKIRRIDRGFSDADLFTRADNLSLSDANSKLPYGN